MMRPSQTPSLPSGARNVLPFRRVTGAEVRPFENCVPLYDLQAAAGRFSDPQVVDAVPLLGDVPNPDDYDWVALDGRTAPERGLFVAQVVGESMNRRIPNGAWCLWRLHPRGHLDGKVVLAQHRDIDDADTGGQFTVKVYESDSRVREDGSSERTRIVLKPASTDPSFQPIVLESAVDQNLRIIAELVEVLR